MIKAVTLDVWNTLLKIEAVYSRLASELSEILAKPVSEISSSIYKVYAKAKELRKRAEFDERKIVEESCELMAKELGIGIEKLKYALIKTFDSLRPTDLLYPEVLDSLEELRGKGLLIGIVGNTLFWPSTLTRLMLQRCGIDKYVDASIFSDEIGICKPDRRIFIRIAKELGVEVSEIAHVGDGVIEDVGGALSSGMAAILINRSFSGMKVIPEIRLAIVSDLKLVAKAVDELA